MDDSISGHDYKGFRKRWSEAAGSDYAPVGQELVSGLFDAQQLDGPGDELADDPETEQPNLEPTADDGGLRTGTTWDGSDDEPDRFVTVVDTAQNEQSWKHEAIRSDFKRLRSERDKLPWEVDSLAGIFNHRNIWKGTWAAGFDDVLAPTGIGLAEVWNSVAVQNRPETVVESKLIPVAPITLKRSRKEVSEEDMRFLSLQRLRDFVLQDPLASKLGSSLNSMFSAGIEHHMIDQSFRDCFRMKAASTLQKRVSSLLRLAKSLRAVGQLNPLRMTESQLYQVLCEWRELGVGATAAQHAIEAIHFLDAAVQLTQMDVSNVVSPRCRGVARDLFLTKDPLRQKHPLTVLQVLHLEQQIHLLPQAQQCICGQLLFCIHACCRWKDAQKLKKLSAQSGMGETLIHGDAIMSKTAITAEARTRFIPYVAIGTGVSGVDWSAPWLAARDSEGLGGRSCTLPSLSERSQCWAENPMSASEATAWLREFLGTTLDAKHQFDVGSHSCKTTLLTWVGRCNQVVFSAAERRTLGHHLDPSVKSVLCYSKEAYTSLYSKVLQVLRLIRGRKFNPDLPAIERVVLGSEQSRLADREVFDKQHVNPVVLNISDSESSVASFCTDDGETHHRTSSADSRLVSLFPAFPGVPEESLRVHAISGLVHVCNEDDVLLCGRSLSCHFKPYASMQSRSYLEACRQCLRAFENRSWSGDI